MAKRLIALCIMLSAMVSFALAAYVKSTMHSLPDLDQIDGYRYVCEGSYRHLYTHDAKGLEDLMENSDAVVLAKTDDAGVLKARSIKKQIHVIERIKGDTEDYLAYYEPVYLMHDHSIIADRGYLPMLPGHEYVLFLKEVKNPEDETCLYYPVSSDIGKYEKGKKATLWQYDESITYRDVKEEAVYLVEGSDFAQDMQERVDLYNKICDEMEDLWR